MPLDRIQSTVLDDILTGYGGVLAGLQSLEDWREESKTLLTIAHAAAYMDGTGVRELSAVGRQYVNSLLANELVYFDAFVDAIVSDDLDEATVQRRLTMYTDKLAATNAAGRYAIWQLPAQPRDGRTQCLSNCGCSWRVEVLSVEELDADAYWQIGKTESCPDCLSNAARWNPLQIRGGNY